MPYALREALGAVRRTPLLTLLSILAIGFSLLVVGLFGLTTYNIRGAIELIEDRVEVVAYLDDAATPAQLAQLQQSLRVMPEVLEVRHVTKEEALATAARELEEFRGVYADLDSNPLPASLEIRLAQGFRTTDAADRVAQHAGGYEFVEEVRFGREWLDKVVFLRRVAAGVAAILGVAFAAVAAIIIGSAVRIAVFARREEISIMRLVGATNSFVRRPFLIEGFMAGLLGGLLALGLTYGIFEFVNATLIRIAWLPETWAAGGVLVGAVFGLLSSALAVRHHLRAV